MRIILIISIHGLMYFNSQRKLISITDIKGLGPDACNPSYLYCGLQTGLGEFLLSSVGCSYSST